MNATELYALFTPQAFAELRAHPEFPDAAHELAAASLIRYAEADETGRWMFRDIGRATLYVIAVVLDTGLAGLTASSLAAAAAATGTASRGRVMAFLERVRKEGEVILPAGPGPWTQRRLQLTPKFVSRLRDGNLLYPRALSRLFPEIVPDDDRATDDAYFRKLLLQMVMFSQFVDASGLGACENERLFLRRDRGISMLFRLMLEQPRPRRRLLEEAPLSRSALSREFDVSRIHINRLLSDGEAMGLLACPSPDRVVFTPRLSEAIETMMARTLQLTRAALLASAFSSA